MAIGSLQLPTQPNQTGTDHHNIVKPIDCDSVPIDTEPHFAVYEFPDFNRSAVIDYAPWSAENHGSHVKVGGLYGQILSVEPNEVFIDVGANIGQMALTGLVGGKTTFAFDPLEYDIKKICTGMKETLDRGWTTQEAINQLHLYRALVGNESQTNVSISRPDDSFGKFEQASLFPGTIGVARKPKSMVKEFVPMVRLDEIIPSDVPIGLVKIDVQGFEWPVVQGMTGLLERKSGYPKIIHYEEQARITQGAGFKMGTVQAYLESYGYSCKRLDRTDISCFRDSNHENATEDLADASTDKEKILFTDHGHDDDTADNITEKVTNFCGECIWRGVVSCDSMVRILMKESSVSREQAIQAVLPECSINYYSAKCSSVYKTVAVFFVVVIMAGIFCHKNCGVGTIRKSFSKPFILLVCVAMLCFSQLEEFMCVLDNPNAK